MTSRLVEEPTDEELEATPIWPAEQELDFADGESPAAEFVNRRIQ